MTNPNNLRFFNGTISQLNATICNGPGLVVVDFCAKWSHPSLKVGNILSECASHNPTVTFLKVEIDQNRELQTHYNVNTIPHLKFFKTSTHGNIEEIGCVIGADLPQIRNNIKQFQ
jgi:thioredoxin-like negative regulator of GroEL